MSILFRNSKSSVRLNNDTKTREARELWNAREVLGPSMKSFGTENLPSLVCNFPSYSFLHSLVQEAIVICFIAAVSCINQTELQFFSFAAVTSHNASLENLYIYFFSLFHYEISRNFRSFLYHCTLFFIPMKATSHLASSSGRNFGTKSLNRENSVVAY